MINKRIFLEKFTFCIVNFNTADLVQNLINSIYKNINLIKNYNIVVFDNSKIKSQKFIPKDNRIQVIDNTKDQILNLQLIKSGDVKHSLSIQYLIDNCKTKHMILFDSDTILKRDINFLEDNCISIYKVSKINRDYSYRTLPILQYFNIELIKKYNIKYYDLNIGKWTGELFFFNMMNVVLSNQKQIKIKEINIFDYIDHLGSGSRKNYRNKEYFKFLKHGENN